MGAMTATITTLAVTSITRANFFNVPITIAGNPDPVRTGAESTAGAELAAPRRGRSPKRQAS
jgi:hypothetical protein